MVINDYFSLRDDYLLGISGTEKHLVRRTASNKYLFIAELLGASRDMKPKMVKISFCNLVLCVLVSNSKMLNIKSMILGPFNMLFKWNSCTGSSLWFTK